MIPSRTSRPSPTRSRPSTWTAFLVALLCSGCVLLAEPRGVGPSAEPTPSPTRTARPPSGWRMRFCDAQIVVKRALIVVGWTRDRLQQDGSPDWFEEVGDDLADLAERALDYLDVVPSWRPAAPLIRAERAMLWAAAQAGRMMEAIGESGRSRPRSPRVRMAMRTVERRLATFERRVADAVDRDIPCARPRIPTTEEVIGGSPASIAR